MSRIDNSIKNIKYSLLGQLIVSLSAFLTRTVFIRFLGAEYLGINGLFSNILTILSFAELGIGSAIVFSMYKPLVENDRSTLIGLMKIYKRAYYVIGIFILIFGSALTPFLDFFINEPPEFINLSLIYLLFVFKTASSYFYSYKRSFLIANQKKYIDAIYNFVFISIMNITQIFVIVVFKEFIFYLIIAIVIGFLNNVMVSRKVDKLYPYLKGSDGNVSSKTKREIIRNVKALIIHRLGSIMVMGTDNLLISKFIGLVEVGLYSNYLLIINMIKQFYNTLFQSIVASVGNLSISNNIEKTKDIFNVIDFFGLWLFGFSSIALLSLFNPFIELWLGDEYLFSNTSVLLIVISFYLTGRRKSVLTYRDALGLFWYDRHKPIFEILVNLIGSIILIQALGFNGVIFGTIISTITTCFWIEPHILYKYGFNETAHEYFKKYLIDTSIIIIIGFLTFYMVSLFNSTFFGFICKVLMTAILPNALIFIVYRKTSQFKYIFSILKSKLRFIPL